MKLTIFKPQYWLVFFILCGLSALAFMLFSALVPHQKPATNLNGMAMHNINAPAFTLKNRQQQPLMLSTITSKPTYLSFGYRHCAETCPVQLATLKQLFQATGNTVNYVWISLDPEQDRDMPSITGQMDFTALIELFPQDNQSADNLLHQYYGQVVRNNDTAVNPISHSSYIYLIDTNGQILALYKANDFTTDMILDDFRALNL